MRELKTDIRGFEFMSYSKFRGVRSIETRAFWMNAILWLNIEKFTLPPRVIARPRARAKTYLAGSPKDERWTTSLRLCKLVAMKIDRRIRSILTCLRMGGTYRNAAEVGGVTRQAIWKRMKSSPEFAAA